MLGIKTLNSKYVKKLRNHNYALYVCVAVMLGFTLSFVPTLFITSDILLSLIVGQIGVLCTVLIGIISVEYEE